MGRQLSSVKLIYGRVVVHHPEGPPMSQTSINFTRSESFWTLSSWGPCKFWIQVNGSSIPSSEFTSTHTGLEEVDGHWQQIRRIVNSFSLVRSHKYSNPGTLPRLWSRGPSSRTHRDYSRNSLYWFTMTPSPPPTVVGDTPCLTVKIYR